MKGNAPGTKLLTAIICLAVLAYFGIQIYYFYVNPLSTTVAYSYQTETSIAVSGWVIRSEQVLEDSTGGLLRITRGEGERVSAGGTVAVVYADQASLDRQDQIDALRARIEQYEYAQDVERGSEAIVKLDSQIRSHLLSLQAFLASDKLDDASDSCIQELRSLIMKRDYAYTGSADAAAALDGLRVQLQSLEAQSAASTRWITAPAAGLYSGVVDGYESVLTPDTMTALTPAALAAVQPGAAQSHVGKLILGDEWYYAVTVPESELERLEIGTTVKLRFAKGIDQDLTVRVHSVGTPVQGSAVVIFRGNTYLPQMTLLRQQTADIIFSTVTGIRVPRNALHVENVQETLEDGTVRESQTTVLYCLVSRTVRFKPVKVLYNGDGYLLVAGTSNTERRRLREGDEIILDGHNIVDGMTIDG